ncbi:hypothetical protein AMATHDRAFT_62850 [Amanita thiersii Skay4041]|uniref:Uncharacterized protein n=1 Tax=Amanita thiersii Skay4041 TaxID=703135 RepID=A0A2A9NG74_9AGAR|nr:hypothetical protein AMATHDRAFT_62850 [Amanita thiersii Skay4041]
MSGKSISTSTLSLRFMQNAQRAKFMKEVDIDKAEVKDDAQWDVGQEVREAWGIASSSSQDTSQSSVVHEASYIPFLFPDSSDVTTTAKDPTPQTRPKGRRMFNSKGDELDQETNKQEPEKPEEPLKAPEPEQVKTGGRWGGLHPAPLPLSAGGQFLRGFDSLRATRKTKSAKEAIFDNTGVGADLRSVSSLKPTTNPSFMKPSGVDAPPDNTKKKSSYPEVTSPERKFKRFYEMDEASEGKVKKRKKKKQET